MTLFDPTLPIAEVEANLNKLFSGENFSLLLKTKKVDAHKIGSLSFVKTQTDDSGKKISGYESLKLSKEALAEIIETIQKDYPHNYEATQVLLKPKSTNLPDFTLPLALFQEFQADVSTDSMAHGFSDLMTKYLTLLKLTKIDNFNSPKIFVEARITPLNSTRDSYRFMVMDKRFQSSLYSYLGPFPTELCVVNVDDKGHAFAFKRAICSGIEALEIYTNRQRRAIKAILEQSGGREVKKVRVAFVDDLELEKSGNSFLRRSRTLYKNKLTNLLAGKVRFSCYLLDSQNTLNVENDGDIIYILAKSKYDSVIFPTKLVRDTVKNA